MATSIDDAIRTALAFEHQVLGVYEAAVAAARDEVGRRVFQALADEEAGHVAFLEHKLAQWTETGHVTPEPVPRTLPDGGAVAEAVARLERQVSPGDRDDALAEELDFLKKALESETETSAFYERMVAELEPEGRALFAPFLDIERGHRALVQAEIDALTGVGFWFDTAEFRFEAG